MTYDGGVLILDAYSLEVEADLPAEGFVRLNPAGDRRHFLLTDLSFPDPGHVVTHGESTVLFADGTGAIQTFASDDLSSTALPETEKLAAAEAHHGVAVRLADGSTLMTIGDEESRSGALVQAADGTEIARSQECLGVHGETVAADEVVALGCEDGVLLYSEGTFTKIQAAADYARSGNLAGHEETPYVLGDYKTDPEADLERPTQVLLVDTAAGTSARTTFPRRRAVPCPSSRGRARHHPQLAEVALSGSPAASSGVTSTSPSG